MLHAAEPAHVLTGTLGKSPIVVELDLANPDEISGRYFSTWTWRQARN